MDEQTTKTDTKRDPLDQLPQNRHRQLTEEQLSKGFGNIKPTRHNIRGLVKTVWALSEKVESLVAALDRVSDSIDELINRQ